MVADKTKNNDNDNQQVYHSTKLSVINATLMARLLSLPEIDLCYVHYAQA